MGRLGKEDYLKNQEGAVRAEVEKYIDSISINKKKLSKEWMYLKHGKKINWFS